MIHVTREGDIAVVAMEHGRANALDLELLVGLRETLAEIEASDARGVVLTGQGRIFCAGVDLKRLLDEDEAYTRWFLPELSGAFVDLFSFPRPVIAAMNGHAVAGGCILACACDLRLMAAGRGRVAVPELQVGVPFPAAALEIFHFVAPERAAVLVYRGLRCSPEEAAAHGLVDEVVAEEELREESIRRASELAAVPATSFTLTKRLLRRPVLDRIERLAVELDTGVAEAWTSTEVREAIRGFVRKMLG